MAGPPQRILILGASGYIGQHLLRAFEPDEVRATYFRKPFANGLQFDARSMDLRDLLTDQGPFTHAIILLGDTRLDSCARDVAASTETNVVAIQRVIDQLLDAGIFPLFASTDNVFDGVDGDYTETSPPNPIVTYGRQKYEVEQYLASRTPEHLILRFTKTFGTHLSDGTIFTEWFDALMEQRPITVATDQILTPVFVDDLVSAIRALISSGANGTFHIAGPVAASREQFLKMMMAEGESFLPAQQDIRTCRINDLDLLERRPVRVSLSSRKLVDHTSIQLTTPVECVRQIFARAHEAGRIEYLHDNPNWNHQNAEA